MKLTIPLDRRFYKYSCIITTFFIKSLCVSLKVIITRLYKSHKYILSLSFKTIKNYQLC